MFTTEYSLWLQFAKGSTHFRRIERLPFAPFVGLTILDNGLGQFVLSNVAWCASPQMFLCQAAEKRLDWTLKQAQKVMSKAGWEEDEESREVTPASRRRKASDV